MSARVRVELGRHVRVRKDANADKVWLLTVTNDTTHWKVFGHNPVNKALAWSGKSPKRDGRSKLRNDQNRETTNNLDWRPLASTDCSVALKQLLGTRQ